jgi:hypothetical protein
MLESLYALRYRGIVRAFQSQSWAANPNVAKIALVRAGDVDPNHFVSMVCRANETVFNLRPHSITNLETIALGLGRRAKGYAPRGKKPDPSWDTFDRGNKTGMLLAAAILVGRLLPKYRPLVREGYQALAAAAEKSTEKISSRSGAVPPGWCTAQSITFDKTEFLALDTAREFEAPTLKRTLAQVPGWAWVGLAIVLGLSLDADHHPLVALAVASLIGLAMWLSSDSP